MPNYVDKNLSFLFITSSSRLGHEVFASVFFSIEFLNGHALRLVPYKWSAARAINVFMKLSKGIPGVGIGEFGRLVCRVVKAWSSFPCWEGRSRDEVDGLAVVRGIDSGG